MSCNCKNKSKKILEEKGIYTNEVSNQNDKSTYEKIINFISKTILFLIGSVLMLLIIIPFSLYTFFNIIYFNDTDDINVTIDLLIEKITKKNKNSNENEKLSPEELNVDEFKPEDYEMVGVEDITEEFKQK